MKKNFVLLALMISHFVVDAQNYPGYSSGNFTGVNAVFFNPSNIADSRFRWNVNLFAVNATIANDYATLKTKGFFKAFSSDSLDAYITRKTGGNANLLLDVDFFGPSVMFNINPRSALAITTRARAMTNMDDIPNDLFNALDDGANGIVYPKNIAVDNFSMSGHSWAEFGVSYGRVIVDNKANFFKGGISVKYLAGIGAGYFGLNMRSTLDEDITGETYLRNGTGQMTYAASNLADFTDFEVNFDGSGVGADIGFAYEYRPGFATTGSDRRDLNKYKFKIDLALLDIGSIQYSAGANNGNYVLNTALNPNPPGSDTLRLARFDGVSDFDDLENALNAAAPMITKTSANGGKFKMSLPTSLSGAIDYHISGGFYASLGGMVALNKSSSKSTKTFKANYIVLTPRFEGTRFGIALPISSNSISGFNAGLSVRSGPVFFGSGAIISSLLKGKTQHADFHFGISFGSRFKNKKEKEEAVTMTPILPVATKVDTDGDGINDEEDKCPAISGLVKYNGCPVPDTDMDGINDEEDKCALEPGIAKYNGCPIPDFDKDGINDEEDKCPNEAGVLKYKGCPIPDTDKDGVNDEEDKCVSVAGVARYGGCPIPDTDKDGVNDEEDKCPKVPGLPTNYGCPEIKKAIIQKVNVAAKGLQFQTGKAIILKTSFTQLNYVAEVLKLDPTLNLFIEGHTDNVGDSVKNLKLSADRAAAAKDYLVKKGIDAGRITTEGFGASKPAAPNTTPAGKAKNRRVEFILRNY